MTTTAESPTASVADGSRRRLDPGYVTVQRIVAGIFSAILMLGGLIAVTLVTLFGDWAPLATLGWFSAALLLPGSLAALMLWWPALSYRRIAYAVSEQGIRIERGVIWRTVASVPRSRVQHTDVSQGPLERSYGLGTLVIYTAGTHHAAVSLEGLPHTTAVAIRDHLIAGGDDDAV